MERLVYSLTLAAIIGLKAEPIYELIPIEVNPFQTNAWLGMTNAVAVAINNQGTVVGSFIDTNGLSATFLWRDGAVTKLAAEYSTYPSAINNKNVVVGSATILVGGLAYQRAWMNSGGTNYLLGGTNQTTANGSSARSINDDGIVVGNLATQGFVFWPSEVAFPHLGGGPCWAEQSMLTLVNNNGVVLGHTDYVAYRWRNYRFPDEWEYLGGITPAAINGSNVIAGNFGPLPATLAGTNVVFLSAPGNHGKVTGMNDAGVVVGESDQCQESSNCRPGGIIWKGATGLDLATLVELPAGAVLKPNGINNSGWIGATMDTGERVVPVVLKPRSGRSLPDIAIAVPGEKVLVTNGIIQARATVNSERSIARMTYVLYARHYVPSHGSPLCWWMPPSINSVPVATNVVTEPPFTTAFENLQPGQYAYEAAMTDSEGIVAYSPPAHVVVAEPARLRIRENWRNEIDVALEGRGGYTHRLEMSEDLLNWEPFAGTIATGGIITEKQSISTNVPRRFFRAAVVGVDLDAFPNAAEFPAEPEPPMFLAGRTLRLDYGILTDEVLFESSTQGKSVRDATAFSYEWDPQKRKLVFRWNSTVPGVEEVLLRPGTWWEFSGQFSSTFTDADNVVTRLAGAFELRPDLQSLQY